MNTCLHCKFWFSDKHSMFPHLGECRLHAPVIRSENQNSNSGTWPSAMKTDWCGEFKKKQVRGRIEQSSST
jgi:hypothetical protein